MIRTKTKTVTKLFSIKNVIIALAAISLLTVTTFIVSGTETQDFVFGSFAKSKTTTCKKPAAPKDCDGVGGDKKTGIYNAKKCQWTCVSPAKASEYYGPETQLGERCPNVPGSKGSDYRYRPGKSKEDCGVEVTTTITASPTTTPTVKPGCSVKNGEMTCNGVKVATPEGYYYDSNGQLVPKTTSTTNCPPAGLACQTSQVPGMSFACKKANASTGIETSYYCCPEGTSVKLVGTIYRCATETVTIPPKDETVLLKPQCSASIVGNVTNATVCYDKNNKKMYECPSPFVVKNGLCLSADLQQPQCSKAPVAIGTANSSTCYSQYNDKMAQCNTGTDLVKGQCIKTADTDSDDELVVIVTTTVPPTNNPTGTPILTETAAPTAAPAPEPEPSALELLTPEKGESALVSMPFGESFVGSTVSAIIDDDANYVVVGTGTLTGRTGIASIKLPSQEDVNAKKDAYNKCMWYGLLFFRKAACMAENQLPVVVYYPPEIDGQTTCSEYQSTQAAVTVATQAGEQLENVGDLEFLDVKCTIY